MADALLKLPDDSGNTGKQLDTTSLTVSAQTVHRERMNIAGSTAAALAEVLNSAPSSEYGLIVRPIPSGTQNVRPTDGTNAITATFDVDTGAGTQYLEGVNLRISGSGGSIEAKGQQAMASSIPVVLASDQSAVTITGAVTNAGTFAVQIDSGAVTSLALIDDTIFTDDTSTHATGTTKVNGIGAVAVPTDTTVDANDIAMPGMSVKRELWGIVRDAAGNGRGANVDANNNMGVVLPAETTKVIGTVNQGTSPWVNNTSQINGVTPLMGNGVTGTGSQRVTIASDNTAFSVNATLSAETTKVLGVTRTADGAGNLLTSNSSTFTAKFGLDANILGTLGTAFTTAGFVDIKGADGNVFVRQATAANLNCTEASAASALTSLQLIDDVVFAEDAAHNTGDKGIMALGVRSAATTDRSSGPTDGDYEPFATNEVGAVWVSHTHSANAGATTMNATSSDGATALTNSAQVIKATAGNLIGYYIYNPNSSAQFVCFYNTAAASVTVGTTNPLFMLTIPATSAANLWCPGGIAFSNAGWSWAAASTAGGAGAPSTALDATAWYK